MAEFRRARLPSISDRQWKRLAPLLMEKGATLEVDQLCSASGVEERAALALVMGLFEEHRVDLYWQVFHCEPHPVKTRPYAKGFQPVPWRCPDCERLVVDPDDLSYELEARLKVPVEFV